MFEYKAVLNNVLTHGEERGDRTGVGTFSTFGMAMDHDLRLGFPLLTTKKVNFKAVTAELFWMLSGSTNTRDLDARIWDEWADEEGELGPIYGKQWRRWTTNTLQYGKPVCVDQMQQLLDGLLKDPNGRRHVVSAWNVADLPDMSLPPCHVLCQFYVSRERLLSCQVYMRSCDVFLGLPFDFASYALLTHIIADLAGMQPHMLHFLFGDLHLYRNHVEQAKELLSRTPKKLPTLDLEQRTRGIVPPSIDSARPGDVHLVGYDPHPAIQADIAI